MKKIMKYTFLLRPALLLLALTLLLSAAVLPIGAITDSFDGNYVGWSYDDGDDSLTAYFPEDSTVRVYRRYEHARLRFSGDYDFLYEKSVTVDGVTYSIHAGDRGSETVVLEDDDGNIRVYASEKGKSELDALMGEADPDFVSVFFRQSTNLRYCDMTRGFSEEIHKLSKDPHAETVTETLYDLRYAPRYELWAATEDGFLSVNTGFLFDLAGELYYLDIFDLPASALDGEGCLIPSESVTVTLYRLPADAEEEGFRGIYSPRTVYRYSKQEVRVDLMEDDGGASEAAVIYLAVIVLGILLPVAPFVLGLCLPHSRRQGYKKRWYLLTILGGAWILLGILLLILMIVVL